MEARERARVRLDVITLAPGSMQLCGPCGLLLQETEVAGQATPEDLPPEWIESFRRLCEWLVDLAARYAGQLDVRIWDARSFQGFFRALRHRAWRYPTFVLNGQKRVVGWDPEAVEAEIRRFAGPMVSGQGVA